MKNISQSEVARLLNVPPARLRTAIKDGRVKPDQEVLGGRLRLFHANRLEEIRRAITHQPEVAR